MRCDCAMKGRAAGDTGVGLLPLSQPVRSRAGRLCSMRWSHSGLRPDQYSLLVVQHRSCRDQRGCRDGEAPGHCALSTARRRFCVALPGWPAGSLHQIADAVGFRYRYDPLLKQFLHPAGLVFLNAAGRVSGYLLGVGYSPGDLALGVTRASTEASNRRRRLSCCCASISIPRTGRYTLAITKVLQLAGLLTVLTARQHDRPRVSPRASR